jgi:hypothetical protein
MRDEIGVPKIVDRSTFQSELDALRVREKAHTHEGDAIAAARRRLPMVEIGCPLAAIRPVSPPTFLPTVDRQVEQSVAVIHRFDSANCGPVCLENFIAVPQVAHQMHPARSLRRCQGILAMSPSPCSAKVHTKRAPDIATSWDGKCLGTRSRTRWAFS